MVGGLVKRLLVFLLLKVRGGVISGFQGLFISPDGFLVKMARLGLGSNGAVLLAPDFNAALDAQNDSDDDDQAASDADDDEGNFVLLLVVCLHLGLTC